MPACDSQQEPDDDSAPTAGEPTDRGKEDDRPHDHLDQGTLKELLYVAHAASVAQAAAVPSSAYRLPAPNHSLLVEAPLSEGKQPSGTLSPLNLVCVCLTEICEIVLARSKPLDGVRGSGAASARTLLLAGGGEAWF
jgi:hypothetical protein